MSKIAAVALFLVAVFGLGPHTLQPFSPSIAKAAHCGAARATCNLGGGNHICEGDCKSSLTCASDGTLKLIPGSCGYGVVSLAISNINLSNVTSSTVTITWTTNKIADARVNYGLTSSYGSTAVSGAPDSTAHSVTITGLDPSTTYHYQVVSSTPIDNPPVESAKSTDRTFLTSSGSTGGGSGPTITFGPRVDATNDRATAIFNTSPDTAAMVEYNTDPGNPILSSQACDAASPCPPPALPALVSGAHSILLTGLTQPNSEYHYKITIVDSAGNVFATNEFTFKTSASSTDHVFSTGGCNDGTPIGQCNVAGQYCRPGGGDPVYDCRPSIPCPKQCGTGFTCQATGDCTQDPPLTGSPTQCNQEKCYQKCNNQSGRMTSQACTIDNDCVDTKGTPDPSDDSRGRCITGAFTNPAAPGCIASWPSCDANVILKVRPDRLCDKWLTCKTSVPIQDDSGKTENQCFDLSICNSLSLAGQCNKLIEGRQCDNDPLRFCTADSDCLAGGKCRAGGTNVPITYKTPSEVGKIQNLSGYAKAGLEWSTISRPEGPPKIEGFFPLSVAKQVGTRVVVPNGDFEQTRVKLVCSRSENKQCTTDDDCAGNGTCTKFVQDENFYADKYWDPLPAGRKEGIILDREGTATNLNRFLKVTPTKDAGSGATTTAEMEISTQKNAEYFLTVRLKSSQGGGFCSGTGKDAGQACIRDSQCSSGLCGGQHINVSLKSSAGTADFGTVVPTTSWRTFHLGPTKGAGGPTGITFTTTAATDPVDFWIDDLNMLPALKVNETDAGLLAQSCRLYPKEDAPACDFTDENSITYTGLKGYCLERDPLNTAICLSWWPVDILSGENIYGQDAAAGYQDRQPLYVCAEAAGRSAPANQAYSADGLSPYRFQSIYGTVVTCAVPAFDCSEIPISYTIRAAFRARATQPAGRADNELHESDIEKIEWQHVWGGSPGSYVTLKLVNDAQFQASSPSNQIQLFEASGDKPYQVFRTTGPVGGDYGTFNATEGNIVWVAQGLGCNESAGLDVCVANAALIFNKTTGKLEQYLLDAWATPWSTWKDFSFREFLAAFKVQIFTRETCTKLVQVADTARVTPWLDRTSSSSTYVVPDLNLHYVSDLAPYGAVAPPSALDTPDLWGTANILKAEGPQVNENPPYYQARAGQPYACGGDCSARVCNFESGNRAGGFCFDSSDCVDSSATPPAQGVCKGVGTCAQYHAQSKSYTKSSTPQACLYNYFPKKCSAGVKAGQVCTDDAFCGGAGLCKSTCPDPTGALCCSVKDDECLAGGASNRGGQSLLNTNPALANQWFTQYHLMRLFAEAYGVWEWNKDARQYEKTLGSLWQPPDVLCKVCSGGTNSGACTADAQCGAGGKCVDSDRHPDKNASVSATTTADYCAIKPSLTNVVDAGNAVAIGEGTSYILKFNANVDREQRPLKRITVDWGDCATNPNCITDDSNLRIAPRDDPNNPHAYTHVYHCGHTDGTACQYQITLQIEDNWGWCNNGTGGVVCPPSTDVLRPWTKGPLIEVRP